MTKALQEQPSRRLPMPRLAWPDTPLMGSDGYPEECVFTGCVCCYASVHRTVLSGFTCDGEQLCISSKVRSTVVPPHPPHIRSRARACPATWPPAGATDARCRAYEPILDSVHPPRRSAAPLLAAHCRLGWWSLQTSCVASLSTASSWDSKSPCCAARPGKSSFAYECKTPHRCRPNARAATPEAAGTAPLSLDMRPPRPRSAFSPQSHRAPVRRARQGTRLRHLLRPLAASADGRLHSYLRRLRQDPSGGRSDERHDALTTRRGQCGLSASRSQGLAVAASAALAGRSVALLVDAHGDLRERRRRARAAQRATVTRPVTGHAPEGPGRGFGHTRRESRTEAWPPPRLNVTLITSSRASSFLFIPASFPPRSVWVSSMSEIAGSFAICRWPSAS